MFITSIKLQSFSEANDFCSITFKKLFASLNDTAVTESLLTELNINHIIKIDSYFKHKFKLKFTAYKTSEITQQLINIIKLFSII